MKTDGTIYRLEFAGEKVISVNAGETILESSLKAGIPHYHECGGQGKCSTCRVRILNGYAHITPPTRVEAELLMKEKFPECVRLACQSKLTGSPVKMQRLIRNEDDLKIYLPELFDQSTSIGEQRELALFFLDIRDFTNFMESRSAYDVIHVIRKLFLLFSKSIKAFNGRLIETAGDNIYAVFGWDEPLAAAVQSATFASFAILKDLETFNTTYAQPYFNINFEVGIGIHAGEVIAGQFEIEDNPHLTVMGLPVNIASRLQSITKDMDNNFIMSDYAYSFLNMEIAAKSVSVHLKGISDDINIRLLGQPYHEHKAILNEIRN